MDTETGDCFVYFCWKAIPVNLTETAFCQHWQFNIFCTNLDEKTAVPDMPKRSFYGMSAGAGAVKLLCQCCSKSLQFLKMVNIIWRAGSHAVLQMRSNQIIKKKVNCLLKQLFKHHWIKCKAPRAFITTCGSLEVSLKHSFACIPRCKKQWNVPIDVGVV